MIASIAPARAERADSSQPLAFDAGRMVLDGKRKVRVLSGGVEISRGTLLLKAAQVELKETPQGGQFAIATATDGQFVTFRQKREGVDETVEGQSRRIEYDSVSETVRFIGQAQVRVLRAGAPADQVSGQTIVYDHGRDVFEVQGGTSASAQPAAPGAASGRVRGVLTPRPTGAASRPAGADAAAEGAR
ncbi:lipopolysaccharide transport periplasmic protein LptA [Sphaerotilus sulfidivorans]|nr:lipopolysaccharide transport periplasmic protein LptA [Sphaerotilus sulfidivorans]QEN02776.1 lipopolysaccharide transport periplasmic protein LptA [Sphaerotilus sulfidivorans]